VNVAIDVVRLQAVNKLALVIVVCGCGKSAPAPATSEPDKPAAPSDWSAQPLDAKIADTADGVGFEISVPKGWHRDTSLPTAVYVPAGPESFDAPSIVVGKLRPGIERKSLDQFAAEMKDPETTLVSKRELADGYLAVFDEGAVAIKVHVDKHKDSVWMNCQAMWRHEAGITNPGPTTAWLSKLCESLVIK
jgi:hypothetical protein